MYENTFPLIHSILVKLFERKEKKYIIPVDLYTSFLPLFLANMLIIRMLSCGSVPYCSSASVILSFPLFCFFFLLYSFIWGSFFGPSYSCLPVPPSTRLLVDNEITAVIFGRETASLCLGLQSDIRSSAALTLFTPRTNHSTVFLSVNIQRNLSFTYLHLAAGFLLDVFSHQRPW